MGWEGVTPETFPQRTSIIFTLQSLVWCVDSDWQVTACYCQVLVNANAWTPPIMGLILASVLKNLRIGQLPCGL